LEGVPECRPLGAHPAPNQANCRDDRDQHDAEKDGVFDKCGTFFVLPKSSEQSHGFGHIALLPLVPDFPVNFSLTPNPPRSSGAPKEKLALGGDLCRGVAARGFPQMNAVERDRHESSEKSVYLSDCIGRLCSENESA
jgi:hypothetical protein